MLGETPVEPLDRVVQAAGIADAHLRELAAQLEPVRAGSGASTSPTRHTRYRRRGEREARLAGPAAGAQRQAANADVFAARPVTATLRTFASAIPSAGLRECLPRR